MMSDNKVALITGSGRGIGRAIALRLAKDGFNIVINDRNQSRANEVCEEIHQLGTKCISFPADVSRKEDVFRMVEETITQFGRLDVMVANAGILKVKPLLEIEKSDLDDVFNVNVHGVLYSIQAAAQAMIDLKIKGKIITASSIAGKRGSIYLAHYAASKAAVIGLTHTAARELAPYGITVNAYCPGVVHTEMWDDIDQSIGKLLNVSKGEVMKKRIDEILLGRVEQPEDVANFVSFLASEDSNYMTGQSIPIDGGIHLT